MSVASPSKGRHAEAREVVDIDLALVEENDHAEVRAIVDKGFTQLMEWLDLRLQQQEDNLRSLFTAREPRKSQGGVDMEPQVTPSSEAPRPPSISQQQEPRKSRGSARMEPQVTSQSQTFKPSRPSSESRPRPSTSTQNSQRRGMQSAKSRAAVSNLTSEPRATSSHMDQDQIWVASLVGVFDQLDLNQTGCIDLSEFETAFHTMGFSDMGALEIFRSFDKSGNGTIDRLEWLHTVSESARGSDDEMKLVRDFLSNLVKFQHSHGTLYQENRARRFDMILRHDSPPRVIWDVMLMVLLFYVTVSVPVQLGFGLSKALDDVDLVVDMIFCCDVALNFRTSYMDRDDTIVVDWKKIGARYLKSWFFIDLFASIPFEFITQGVMADVTPVRLLKFFKVAKVLKLLRITKIWSFRADSETMELWKIRLSSRPCTAVLRMLKLLSIAFLFAHWLTCFSFAVDSSAFDEYFDSLGQVPDASQKYLAGMYWAMTTISTVGYGDITPNSDQERAYSMLAMVVGGSLYGFIVGSVTSVITGSDVRTFAYQERMDAVQSWLECHGQIPLLLRRRLRKHFKSLYRAKTVIDDHDIVDNLSGELRGDAAFFLIDEHVRVHPMVANLSNSSLAELVYVMQETHARAHEFIVHMDDPGIGMYFLVEGLGRYDQGMKWQPPGSKATPTRFQHIMKGDSFGEEIIFGLAETYAYTVIAIVDCKFKWIDETHFREHFTNLPDLHEQMYAAILRSHISSHANASGTNERIVREVTL